MTLDRHRAALALPLAEAALAAALLALFLLFRDLPLVDLPQHAVQIANWMRIDAGQPGFDNLELNFRTPYMLAYPVARALAPWLGVLTALKLVLWASIALQARALRFLCERLGHDGWLGLLGFPLGLGYSFCFGFVSFCAALPLVYLAFAYAASHRAAPSWRGGLGLGALFALLLVAHGVAFAFCAAVLAPILLLGAGPGWQRAALPAVPPLLLAAIWLVPAGSSTRLGGDLWRFEPERLLELPAQLVGIGSADRVATLLGIALLSCLVSSLGPPRGWLLAVPLLLACLGYLLFPTLFRGAGPLGPRFASFLVPSLLLAFLPRRAGSAHRIRRAATLGVTLASLLLLCTRLPAFEREMAEFHRLMAQLAPGLRLRPLVFERESAAFPGLPALLHVPAYYALEKSGDAGYSFAMYSISVVRLRAGAKVKMWGGAEWAPQRFDATREANDYDYFLVKSSVDPTAALFGGESPAALLEIRVGGWWAFRRSMAR